MPNQEKVKSFKSVGNVLNRVVSDLGLEERLRQHTLMELWPQIVGDPWAKCSRALFIDSELFLVVTVQDASTGQELSFLKRQILGHLRKAARAIGIDIKGLRFDLKHYHVPNAQKGPSQAGCLTLPEPTRADLTMIKLTQHEEQELDQLKHKLSDQEVGEALSQRILSLFEGSLRLKCWRLTHGYPSCSSCGYPEHELHGQQ
ncbi:MAG: DUF721 domain-containing protein, partial [Candidatus Melainabacteria bacterium]|nr:DUF721 domain-containing protein [Candidatus Melainabacteria bacterium]